MSLLRSWLWVLAWGIHYEHLLLQKKYWAWHYFGRGSRKKNGFLVLWITAEKTVDQNGKCGKDDISEHEIFGHLLEHAFHLKSRRRQRLRSNREPFCQKKSWKCWPLNRKKNLFMVENFWIRLKNGVLPMSIQEAKSAYFFFSVHPVPGIAHQRLAMLRGRGISKMKGAKSIL